MAINKVFICGRLGRDPILRPTAKEGSMTVLRIASNYNDTTEWFTLFAFAKTAEFIAKYAKKGQEVFVEGRLSSKSYKDSNGFEREGMVIIVSSVELGRLPVRLQPFAGESREVTTDDLKAHVETSMFEPV